jgi:heterodisulfide reductase subunit C
LVPAGSFEDKTDDRHLCMERFGLSESGEARRRLSRCEAEKREGADEVTVLGGSTIRLTDLDLRFSNDIKRLAGTDFRSCLQCRSCSSGCPFSDYMDYMPNGVMRLVQLGLKTEALKCNTIWICVGCHTCSIQCPMAIDIPGVMDALREKAVAEHVDIIEPDILNFHREVLNSIERYGRTHKLEIMMRYKLKKFDLLSDLQVGIKMLAKRKLDLTPSRIEQIGDMKKIFKE